MRNIRRWIVRSGVTVALLFTPISQADDSPATGEVYVDVGEQGGVISVDGVATEFLAPSLLPDIPVGFHQIEVTTMCGMAATEVEVREGRVTRAELEMEMGLGELRLSSMPGNAQVSIDGEVAGNTPIILRDLACGILGFSLSAEGYLDHSSTVEVGGTEPTRHHVVLTPMTYGELVVHVTPLDSEVWIDDAYVATGPVTVGSLLAGEHSYSIRREGYLTSNGQVEITTDSVTNLEVLILSVESDSDALSQNEVLPVVPVVAEGEVLDGEAAEAEAVEVGDSSDGDDGLAEEEVVSSGTSLEAEPLPSRSVGSLALNSSVTAVGLGLSAWGVVQYGIANEAYNRFLGEESDFLANDIYDKEVAPAKNSAILFGSLGGVTLGAAVWLWLDTDYTVAVSQDSLSVIGRW